MIAECLQEIECDLPAERALRFIELVFLSGLYISRLANVTLQRLNLEGEEAPVD